MSRVSAIIVSYNTGPRLKECLYALVSDPEVDEVVLVDNGNPDAMTEWMQAFAAARDSVHLLRGHGNVGFGAGVNLGAKAASGNTFLIINPDAVLRRGSVAALQEAASSLEPPWIIGGKIFDLRGREERGPRRRELTLWRALTSFMGVNTWTLERMMPPEGPIEMDVISGAFFLTTKESFEALNGFDEGYFLHVEDIDLCVRCRRAGGTVLYQPKAGALHYGSTSDAPSRVVAQHKADSFARYFRKRVRGPIHKLITEAMLPFIRAALLARARD